MFRFLWSYVLCVVCTGWGGCLYGQAISTKGEHLDIGTSRDSLDVFANIEADWIRVRFRTAEQEVSELFRIGEMRRQYGHISEVTLINRDDRSVRVRQQLKNLGVLTDLKVNDHVVTDLSISTRDSDLALNGPPVTTQFSIEMVNGRWGIRYGEPKAVEKKSVDSRLVIIDPPYEQQGTADYRVEILDRPDTPYFNPEMLKYGIRVAVHVSDHKLVNGTRVPAGVKNGYRGRDSRLFSGWFELDEQGYVAGGTILMAYVSVFNANIQPDPRIEATVKLDAKNRSKPRVASHVDLFTKAQSMVSKGKFLDAVDVYTKCAANATDFEKALRKRAFCFEVTGDWKRAEEDYSELHRRDPKNMEHVVSRALCRMERRDWNGAMEDIKKAEVDLPNNPTVFMVRGLLEHRMTHKDVAMGYLTSAMRANPIVHIPLFNRWAPVEPWVSTEDAYAFLSEFSGENEPDRVWDRLKANMLAFEMSDFFESFDREGRRVFDDPQFGSDLRQLQEHATKEAEAKRASLREPTEAEQQLLLKRDEDSIEGTWIVAAIQQSGEQLNSPRSPACNVICRDGRLELVIDNELAMTLVMNLKRSDQVKGKKNERIRWWGTCDGYIEGVTQPLRGWYLYQPGSQAGDAETFAIKFSPATTEADRHPKHAPPSEWSLGVIMTRASSMRDLDSLMRQAWEIAKQPKGAIATMQGEWNLVELNGERIDKPNEHHYTIRGNRLTKRLLLETGKPSEPYFAMGIEWEIEIDATSNPPRIDWVYANEERRRLGIYRQQGDTLTLVHGKFGNRQRPTSFNVGRSLVLESLKLVRVTQGTGQPR